MITTWQDTMEAVVSDGCIVTTTLVQNFMQSEIDELRAALTQAKAELEDGGPYISELRKKHKELRAENARLREIVKLASDSAEKFRGKVHAGTARSVETYDDMTLIVKAVAALEENYEPNKL